MNRWKGSISWVLIWSLLILVGGLILCTGYLSVVADPSQVRTEDKTEILTNKTEQVAESRATEDLSNREEVHEEQKRAHKQTDIGVKGLTDKDFPSPVQGEIVRSIGNYYSNVCGMYLFHAGLDFVEPEGTVIRATHGGNVIFAGPDPILGQKVTLDCGEDWLVTYGGLDNLRVKVGERVETQGALGQVGFFPGVEGENGQSQLHYEVWHGDEAQRPSRVE